MKVTLDSGGVVRLVGIDLTAEDVGEVFGWLTGHTVANEPLEDDLDREEV